MSAEVSIPQRAADYRENTVTAIGVEVADAPAAS
jgi:hypothetical protein